jgi:hypothetical protein
LNFYIAHVTAFRKTDEAADNKYQEFGQTLIKVANDIDLDATEPGGKKRKKAPTDDDEPVDVVALEYLSE